MSELRPYPPGDFDEFWSKTAAQAHSKKLEFTRRPISEGLDAGTGRLKEHTLELIDFNGYGGALHGWIAYPPGAKDLPAFLWIPAYGRESAMPDDYGTREGYVSMSFNFFGDGALYEEDYLKERGYFAEGVESPETWVFRSMFQNAALALRVLQAQPEVDQARVAAMGMSQGGGISIWLGAWTPAVRAVCADMPFLGGFTSTLSRPVHRYPTKELIDYIAGDEGRRASVFKTLAYFDTINHATRCLKPTHVSLGLKDPAARPESVRAIYRALPGQKALTEYDWGHDWYPDMIPQNRAWLEKHL